MEDNLYDVSHYTDKELYQLMDLNHPTDRELEAKIYSLIHKYEEIDNKMGKQMHRFFIDVFHHFFETDEDEPEDEAEEDADADFQEGMEVQTSAPPAQQSSTAIITSGATGPALPPTGVTKETVYTTNFNYVKGSLNPILKETIKRVMSVDSQFRNTLTYPYSTDFTFNLSEVLRDVVSLKLYSVQIPYNWYVIGKYYGNNFFYIKGNADGINNGNFDYKVSVPYGNYTASNLISTLNDSIQSVASENPDISFGSTSISYNSINTICTINLDIKNIYNETNYYIQYPDTAETISIQNISGGGTSTYINSIPYLFGYASNLYTPFTIFSSPINVVTNATNYLTQNTYIIDNSNNFFTIYIYKAVVEKRLSTTTVTNEISSFVDPTTTPPLHTITFTLSLNGTHTIQDIIDDINAQMVAYPEILQTASDASDPSLSPVASSMAFVDSSNVLLDSSGNKTPNIYRFSLSIRLNRKAVPNDTNLKVAVVFPDVPPTSNNIWWSDRSCFKFMYQQNELQTIFGDKESFITTYPITSSPFLRLKCVTPGFGRADISLNDFTIPVANSTGNGYTFNQYMNTINTAMSALMQTTNNQVRSSINAVGTLTTHTANVNADGSESAATTTIEKNIVNMNFSISNVIGASNFFIDTATSFLNTLFFTDASGTTTNNIIPCDNGSITSTLAFIPITVDQDNNTFYIGGQLLAQNIQDYPGTVNGKIPVIIDSNTYYMKQLIEAILTKLTAIGSPFNFSNVNLVYSIVNNGLNMTLSFDFKVEAILTNADYDLKLYDSSNTPATIGGTWNEFLGFDQPTYSLNIHNTTTPSFTPPYNLSSTVIEVPLTRQNGVDIPANTTSYIAQTQGISSQTLISKTASTVTTVFGVNSINSSLMYLDASNNYFDIYPIYNSAGGVYNTATNSNATTDNHITIQLNMDSSVSGKYYTKEEVRDAINTELSNNILTYGSFFNTDDAIVSFRLNINKVFTASDYTLSFFDTESFTRCNFGANASIQTTTADTTVGWILGFRSNTSFNLTYENYAAEVYPYNNFTYDTSTNIVSIQGDTSVNVNLYNYLLIVLDDFTQNHLNDGLVTTINAEQDVSLPSYTNNSHLRCNNQNETLITNDVPSQNNYNRLTNNQLYSANQVLTAQQNSYLNNRLSTGPFIQDIFGVIPVKTAGLSNGQTYVEFGGTLQIQERVYFGPVNIRRMRVKLMTDKGNTLDLNGQNWSFSLITEQLYNPKK